MQVEQWGIRVPIGQGEERRQELLGKGLLDTALRIRREGDSILFPVREPVEGAVRCGFEAPERNRELPRHELIGGIAVMQNRDEEGARELLASRPNLHTVLCPTSEVSGEYRTRTFEVLAGTPTTRTRVTEYGLRFDIDLTVAYFSARLATERHRLLARMEPGERVLDMFAGVGPFAITLAERARLVIACDINPSAVLLMRRNIALNRTKNVLSLLADAGRIGSLYSGTFNRIVMNLPLAASSFLPAASLLCREGGAIHLYALQSREGEYLPEIEKLHPANVEERFVRSYSPAEWHAVYDIFVGKE